MSLWSGGESPCCGRLALNAPRRLVSSTVSSLSTFPSLTSSRYLQMPRVISTSALSSPMRAPENPGEFLKHDRQLLHETLRLNTIAHLDITHHFGQKLGERRRGGIILVGALGAENGIPCMANDGGAKAYVHSLGEALHYEFKPLGVYVTVLAAGVTNTAVIDKFGLDPKTMPMKPMSVEQCVSEGISGLRKNRSRVVPGRLNRIMNALVPAFLARKLLADLLGKGIASKAAPANARAEA